MFAFAVEMPQKIVFFIRKMQGYIFFNGMATAEKNKKGVNEEVIFFISFGWGLIVLHNIYPCEFVKRQSTILLTILRILW